MFLPLSIAALLRSKFDWVEIGEGAIGLGDGLLIVAQRWRRRGDGGGGGREEQGGARSWKMEAYLCDTRARRLITPSMLSLTRPDMHLRVRGASRRRR